MMNESKQEHGHYYRIIGLTETNDFVLVCQICFKTALASKPTNDFKLVLNNGEQK